MTTAIELRNQQAANGGAIARSANLEPQSFGEVKALADYVAKSGLFAVKTPEQAMMVMLTGASLGLSPVAALRGVHVIQGKATLDATLVTALVQQHPDCEYWRVAENTNERCTIETKRRGHPAPVSRTWTLDDAKRADLLGNPTWKKYPAAMLRARCTTDLARGVYGDALFGVYTPEELESAPREAATYEAQPAAASVTVVAKPVPAPGDAILFAIGQASTVDELKALSKRAAELTTKGTPERQRLSDALQARRREIEGGDGGPKGGGGAPKPEAQQGAADARGNGEPVTGEHEPAPSASAAWTLDAWRAHMDAKTNRYEAANSYARHQAELEAAGIDDDASDVTIGRLIALGLDESHAVEAVAAACDRRDGKKSGKAA